MCEPNHSIIQYPTQDSDSGDNLKPLLDVIPVNAYREPDGISPFNNQPSGWCLSLRSEIDSFIHFSLGGKGHSEAMAEMPAKLRRRLPDDTKYEAQWWERKVIIDGRFYGPKWAEKDAFLAAEKYAKKVSIGNIHLLRQFLDRSMRMTEKHFGYIVQFMEMLNKKGQNYAVNQFKRLCGIQQFSHYEVLPSHNLEIAIKVMLGITRKRDLLMDVWTND